MSSVDWTRDEVEATVADYFAMLDLELRAERYSKADHNRRLQQRIGRSKGSIEFRHQNISAVLINFRQPFIRGYLPRRTTRRCSNRWFSSGLRHTRDSSRGSRTARC
jgi:hypothetical protein